ncbi:hypothetical protein MEX01_48760 [Methylorubrum extorquens]|uniref:hypothetical protein n=1 Tax=Methylorubrum extorquens TaxID=408 RepID=UPI001168534D|nr:hypothetical protein [Methylorubrum extorquens]GEL44285.1 hypothetical protein MEX01_48760 [Methylorubrum extorquens]
MTSLQQGAIGAETKTGPDYWAIVALAANGYEATIVEQSPDCLSDDVLCNGSNFTDNSDDLGWTTGQPMGLYRLRLGFFHISDDDYEVTVRSADPLCQVPAPAAGQAGAAPDSLREAIKAADLHECWVNGDTADVMTNPHRGCANFDQIVARCATGELWRKRAVAIAMSLNFVREQIASHPAGQSTGPGTGEVAQHIRNLESIGRRQDAEGICRKAVDAGVAALKALAARPAAPEAQGAERVRQALQQIVDEWDEEGALSLKAYRAAEAALAAAGDPDMSPASSGQGGRSA